MAPDQHRVGLWVVLDCLAQAVCELTLPGCVLNYGHNAVAIEAVALNTLHNKTSKYVLPQACLSQYLSMTAVDSSH
jgi:hypothetical protein